MGARSNLFFKNGNDGIGIYSHWAGKDMADAAMAVLESKAFKNRLGDSSYATRIGVQLALEQLGSQSGSETGFGLWTAESGVPDNEFGIIVIDVNTGKIAVTNNPQSVGPAEWLDSPTVAVLKKRMSFNE